MSDFISSRFAKSEPICICRWLSKSNYIKTEFASEDGRQNQILNLTNLHLRMVGKIKLLYQNRFASKYGQENQIISKPICIWGWSAKSNFKPYQFASEDGWQNQTFISKPICIQVWSGKSNYIKTDLHLRMVGKIKF